MAGNILLISTSYDGNLGKYPTGSWVEEIAAPYYAWRMQGIAVTIASIKGGDIVFDPSSMEGDFLTQEGTAFLGTDLYKNTKAISEFTDQELDAYDAVFLPGGHGMMFDGANDESLRRVVEYFATHDKIVAAVCHGPAGLLKACKANGESILKGKRATGFSNSEENALGEKGKAVPFSLEDRMKDLGADYTCGIDWSDHVVCDGKLVTGQNPQSSQGVAEAVIALVLPGIDPQHGKGPGEGFHARDHPVTREHHEHGEDKAHAPHPQAHMHQWQSPVRQTSHTGPGGARSHQHPDKSYVG